MKKLSDVTLTPAYGRDYKSKKEVLADLNDGKDFIVHLFTGESTPCSVRDLEGTVNVRYAQRTKVAVVHVENGVAR